MLINLTPHEVVLINKEGDKVIVPTSGTIARCKQDNVVVGEHEGVLIYETTFGDVYDLPEEKEDVLYIVSRLVMSACPSRRDLVCPGILIRDDEGRIVAANGLSR